MIKRTVVLSLFTIGIAACSKAANTPASFGGGLAAGIMNGTDVTQPDAYSKHVVFINTRMGNGVAACTGSILDSQTILTAAHCVYGARSGAIAFSLNVQEHTSQSVVRRIDKFAINANYKPVAEAKPQGGDESAATDDSPGPLMIPTVSEVETAMDQSGEVDYDIAVIHFTGGLPEGFSPVQLATDPSVVQPGDELHMIGYGLAEVDAEQEHGQTVPVEVQSTVGQLRETEVPVASYDTNVGMIFTNSRQTGVCNGDSGGPAFMRDSNGQLVQVGIAEAVATAYCNSVSMHTAIFPFLSWIKHAQQKLESRNDPQLLEVRY